MPHKFTADQLALIKDLGPYAKHAKSNHTYTEFEARVFNLWSICWPLKAKDFDDQDFLEAYWTIVKWLICSSTFAISYDGLHSPPPQRRSGKYISPSAKLVVELQRIPPSTVVPAVHALARPIAKKSTVQQPSLPTEDKP
ncbi:unnamed protein product [Cyclocybe aegerita]|uniref:Uncharacterized protein n=1 Tax=Cyclocybe aegerita TaxID=1973307 RepID=A0A8S0WU43_CYCAE|nr:unnamed protein product [Cyclocybe aegerita]